MGALSRVCFVVVAFIGTSFAASGADAVQAFDKLKNLEGEWVGHNSREQAVRVTFSMVGDGTALMERLEVAETHDMLTLYHLDGERLMLTHYCAAGNQPRMRWDGGSESEPKFEFFNGTHLKSDQDGHMQRAEFFPIDDENLKTVWTWAQEGADHHAETFTLQRRKPTSGARSE